VSERSLTETTEAHPAAVQAPADAIPLPPFWPALAGEFMGTFILVFFGVGAINAAVATGAQVGLWQVAVVWAFGVSLAIYTAASLSGAHINPAITAMALAYERFPVARVVPYWLSQTAGAACASLVLYAMFAEAIVAFERLHGLLRGGPGSELSAMMFGEYFPNPAIHGTAEAAWRVVSERSAFIAEMVGTAMLAFLVSALTGRRNAARPPTAAAALVIGVGVAAIISIVGPLTQAGINPARDFGPRLVAFFLGWGEIAIPGPRGGWLTVYIVAPIVGALIGGGIYRLLAACMPGLGSGISADSGAK
jgi:glycerol uptake facilitator protein